MSCTGAQWQTRASQEDVHKRCARQNQASRCTSASKRAQAPPISESMARTAGDRASQCSDGSPCHSCRSLLECPAPHMCHLAPHDQPGCQSDHGMAEAVTGVLGSAQFPASITAPATFGYSASPDNVTCWHIMVLQ